MAMMQTGLLARWFGAEVLCASWGAPLSGAVSYEAIFLRLCIGEALISGHLLLEVEHASHRWCEVRPVAQAAVHFCLAERDFHQLAG